MAAYRDKKNGKWFVKFRYRTWQNEMKWITKRGFATKRDAQTWERDFLHQQSGNPTMGFKEFVDIYKRDRLLRLKPSTQCLKESIRYLGHLDHPDVQASVRCALRQQLGLTARSAEMDLNSDSIRVCPGMYIINTLTAIEKSGDSFVYEWELYQLCCNSVKDLTEQEYRRDIAELLHRDMIRQEGHRIYLTKQLIYENTAAASLSHILSDLYLDPVSIPEHIRVGDICLTDEQRQAVSLALSHRLFLILGGAGTGKTTLLQALINNRPKGDFIVCAPTGKAARNLTDKTGYPASTVHSAMHVGIDEFFLKQITWPHIKLLIVDEASMVSLGMLSAIFACADHDCRVVLVGDPYQLQSIGAGNVIPDLLELGVPHFILQEIHRQAGAQNALMYNVTRFHHFCSGLDLQWDDSFIMQALYADDVANAICNEAIRRYRAGESVQVLSPFRTGNRLSVNALNHIIRQQLNPSSYRKTCLKTSRGLKLYDGDRVMIRQNDRDRDCCNGDIGILRIYINTPDWIDFAVILPDGRCPRWQDTRDAICVDHLDLAYAMTVHKAQGSEYDTVLMVLNMDFARMLHRNLFYTATTRAKKKLILYGDPACIDYAMQNMPPPRRSMLVQKTRMSLNDAA